MTYFVYRLDPSIAPEIGTVLLDGRAHLILVLSERELPIHEDWYAHLSDVPMSSRRMESGFFVPLSSSSSPTVRPLLHLHEMQCYTRTDMRCLLHSLLQRKREFGW
jgi:hypothetical protein